MRVTIRRFERSDIPKKVEWINDPRNNRYLHYDVPISVEGTERWFDGVSGRQDRYDAVIECDGTPVGTIGLLDIDRRNSKAEYYIAMGEVAYKGRGVAKSASKLLLRHAFETLGLNRVYLMTEAGNLAARSLFERIGFVREGVARQDVASGGGYADRVIYGMTRSDYEKGGTP